MTFTSKESARQELPRQSLNGHWQLRVRSEVVVCPDCGALLPRSSNPQSCALCGSGPLPQN
jgi:rubrerythrin